MADRFQACGIAPDRLILEGGVDRLTLLRSYGQVDISLDTWPYSGGNTIAESLWHGVPVVTYRGDRFASAYGASLVGAAGCADLVGTTPAEYVEVAARLAADSQRLVHLRHNLRAMSLDHGLGDSRRFARKLEDAFIHMLDELP
jgi:predicted O-linked N-acetylglucosamine transferase (SPINDLY family)